MHGRNHAATPRRERVLVNERTAGGVAASWWSVTGVGSDSSGRLRTVNPPPSAALRFARLRTPLVPLPLSLASSVERDRRYICPRSRGWAF